MAQTSSTQEEWILMLNQEYQIDKLLLDNDFDKEKYFVKTLSSEMNIHLLRGIDPNFIATQKGVLLIEKNQILNYIISKF